MQTPMLNLLCIDWSIKIRTDWNATNTCENTWIQRLESERYKICWGEGTPPGVEDIRASMAITRANVAETPIASLVKVDE